MLSSLTFSKPDAKFVIAQLSTCLASHCEAAARYQVPPMSVHKYVDENNSVAMLATKRSAGMYAMYACVKCE